MELLHETTSRRITSGISDSTVQAVNRQPYLVGSSPAITNIKKLINQIAPTEMTVLITGESGTGKEEIARMIHLQSKRAAAQFTAINCAAFPSELIESELFGHERGAFTGACAQRVGKLEAADGSTLLLDEISEMPLAMQAKLLRFLQEREIQRVGSNRTIKINVRIIAATNRVLTDEIEAGRFRPDLYYRLQICPIRVLPLRDRRKDIPQLVEHFARLFAKGEKPPLFASEALEVLERHEWKGNVRELGNAVEFAVCVCTNGLVTVGDLPEHVRSKSIKTDEGCGKVEEQGRSVTVRVKPLRMRSPKPAVGSEWEEGVSRLHSEKVAMARQVISVCNGNKTRAAKEMKMTRQNLYKLLKHGS